MSNRRYFVAAAVLALSWTSVQAGLASAKSPDLPLGVEITCWPLAQEPGMQPTGAPAELPGEVWEVPLDVVPDILDGSEESTDTAPPSCAATFIIQLWDTAVQFLSGCRSDSNCATPCPAAGGARHCPAPSGAGPCPASGSGTHCPAAMFPGDFPFRVNVNGCIDKDLVIRVQEAPTGCFLPGGGVAAAVHAVPVHVCPALQARCAPAPESTPCAGMAYVPADVVTTLENLAAARRLVHTADQSLRDGDLNTAIRLYAEAYTRSPFSRFGQVAQQRLSHLEARLAAPESLQAADGAPIQFVVPAPMPGTTQVVFPESWQQHAEWIRRQLPSATTECVREVCATTAAAASIESRPPTRGELYLQQLSQAQEMFHIAERCQRKGDLDMAYNCYHETTRLCPHSEYAHRAERIVHRMDAVRNLIEESAPASYEELPMPSRMIVPVLWPFLPFLPQSWWQPQGDSNSAVEAQGNGFQGLCHAAVKEWNLGWAWQQMPTGRLEVEGLEGYEVEFEPPGPQVSFRSTKTPEMVRVRAVAPCQRFVPVHGFYEDVPATNDSCQEIIQIDWRSTEAAPANTTEGEGDVCQWLGSAVRALFGGSQVECEFDASRSGHTRFLGGIYFGLFGGRVMIDENNFSLRLNPFLP